MTRTHALVLLIVSWIVITVSPTAQAAPRRPTVLWRKEFGVSTSRDGAKDVAVDSQNNAIICGEYASKGFVRKYTPQGDLLWDFQLNNVYTYAQGEQNYTYISSVAVDQDNFIYYAGRATYDDYVNLCYGKLSPTGELIDSYRHERRRGSACYDMAQGEGLLAIGGHMYGGFGTKFRQTSNTFIGILDYDLKLKRRKDNDRIKTATSKSARGQSVKIVTGIASTSDGGWAIAGRDTTTGDYHRYIQRRSKTLGVKWTKRLAERGWHKSEYPKVAVDSQDAIFVSMSYTEKRKTDDHFYVAKYGPKGKLLWERKAPTSKADYARGMAVLPDDSVLVACKYSGKAALAHITTYGQMTAPPFLLYPKKIADSGAAESVAIANDGTIYVVGTIEGQLVDADNSNGSKQAGPWAHYGGACHGFILKISLDGTKPSRKITTELPRKPKSTKRTLFD